MIHMQCPECGLEEVSGEATACPQCGYPIATLSGFSIAQRLREAAPEQPVISEEASINISPKNFRHSEKGSKKKASRFFSRSRKKLKNDSSIEEPSVVEPLENRASKNQEAAVASLTQSGLFNPVPENSSAEAEPVQKEFMLSEPKEAASAETQTAEELSAPGINDVQLTEPVTPLLPEKDDQIPLTIETSNIRFEEEPSQPMLSESQEPLSAEGQIEEEVSAPGINDVQLTAPVTPLLPEKDDQIPPTIENENIRFEEEPSGQADVKEAQSETSDALSPAAAVETVATALASDDKEHVDPSSSVISEQSFDTTREEDAIESHPESEEVAFSEPTSVPSAEAAIHPVDESAVQDEITVAAEVSAASSEATESLAASESSEQVPSFSAISDPVQEEFSENEDQAEEISEPKEASIPELESSTAQENFQDDRNPENLNESLDSAQDPSVASRIEDTPETVPEEASIPEPAASTEERFRIDFEDAQILESQTEKDLQKVDEEAEEVFAEDSPRYFGVRAEEKSTDSPFFLDNDGSSCYECGKEVDANANFCPHCHASLLRRICAGCNRLVAGNTPFCAYCGTAASAVAEPPRNFASILAVFIILFTGILIFLAKDFVFEDPTAIKNRILAHEKSGVTAPKTTPQNPIQKSQNLQAPIQKFEKKDESKRNSQETPVGTSPKLSPTTKPEGLREMDLPKQAAATVAPKIVTPKEQPAVTTSIESKPKNINVEAANQAPKESSTKTRALLKEVPVRGIPQFKHRDPTLARYLNAVGYRLIREKRYDEAIPILQRSVSYFPDRTTDIGYAYALFNLGHALRMSGRAHEAIPILEARMRIDNQRETVRRELEAAKLAALQD